MQYVGPRNIDSFYNFTIFHDPNQGHINGKYIKIDHSLWDDVK